MTNKEAVKLLKKGSLAYSDVEAKAFCEAYDMAIKALEAPTGHLDKIRAEIEAKCCITVGRENDGAITLHDVFEIIDKYKAKNE